MNVAASAIPELLIVQPRVFEDARGSFFESWSKARYGSAGIPEHFVQDNVSHSVRGVLRGLHYQLPNTQGKLISVLSGEVWDVAVDIRRGSPTFARWVAFELSCANRRQLYIPPGFAHGFQVTSAEALVQYKCTSYYDSSAERTVIWCDTDLEITWPLKPILSPKDEAGVRLRDLSQAALPLYAGT